MSKEQLLQEVFISDLIFTPNKWSKYSNIGFSLLGLILENILQMPYQKAIELLILRKLEGTQILPDYSTKSLLSFADEHSRPLTEGQHFPLKHAPAFAMAPATGFCGNAEDTTLFFDKLLCGRGVLKRETQQELLSLSWPVKNTLNERYRLGLQFQTRDDIEMIGHSGGYPGFSTYTGNWVGSDYVISFFLNTNNFVPRNSVFSVIKIFKLINSIFTDKEAKKAIISGPLMNIWGSKLFVLNEKIGLCLPLESWSPWEEASILTRKDGKEYLNDQESGYEKVGENISFKKDTHNHILSAKLSSASLFEEKVFLEKFKQTLL